MKLSQEKQNELKSILPSFLKSYIEEDIKELFKNFSKFSGLNRHPEITIFLNFMKKENIDIKKYIKETYDEKYQKVTNFSVKETSYVYLFKHLYENKLITDEEIPKDKLFKDIHCDKGYNELRLSFLFILEENLENLYFIRDILKEIQNDKGFNLKEQKKYSKLVKNYIDKIKNENNKICIKEIEDYCDEIFVGIKEDIKENYILKKDSNYCEVFNIEISNTIQSCELVNKEIITVSNLVLREKNYNLIINKENEDMKKGTLKTQIVITSKEKLEEIKIKVIEEFLNKLINEKISIISKKDNKKAMQNNEYIDYYKKLNIQKSIEKSLIIQKSMTQKV